MLVRVAAVVMLLAVCGHLVGCEELLPEPEPAVAAIPSTHCECHCH